MLILPGPERAEQRRAAPAPRREQRRRRWASRGAAQRALGDRSKRPLNDSILIKESELHRKEVTASILYINRLYPHSLFLTVLLTIEHYLRTYCIHR